ncbi:calcium-binding protein [Hyphococcus flavus]|uniref:Calcium-binding protein n=1 Tax=Hyphococcus flavus TaxID=1866326 RepID=A0AAF0CEY6_9PROT|nr:calcium-binding protein [Hyphococcus flavus]WDI30839.1 calcium-binding protein [Hyphococcus flavus]
MPVQLNTGQQTVYAAPTLIDETDGIGISELAGIIGFNRVPPDHNGAVGQDHVVSVLNHVMQIYDKSGDLLSTQTLDSLFGVVPGAFVLPVDPNILYDPYTDRFVYVSFEVTGIDGSGSNPSNDVIQLNVAVSKTGNPLDGWHVQSIDAKTVVGGENTWSDYPGIAVDGEAIYISANMFQFDPGSDGQVSFAGNRLWIVDKGEGGGGLYDGGAISFTKHDPVAEAGGGAFNATLMPVRYANDSLGGPGVFLASASGASNGVNEILQVFHVTDPLGTPDFSVQQISLGDVSNENAGFLPQATQLGTNIVLGSGDPRINSGGAVWFEGKIYLTFSVSPKFGPNSSQTTTHWVELDATSPAAISLLQQGNIGGEDIAPGTHTFHSSINVNKDGSVLINFSASGPSIYPGAYYAIRGADDPIGEFGPAQTLSPGIDYYFRNRLGEGISSQTTNRWGDFSGVSVDPVDGTTFWFFNQFADTRGSPNAAGQDGRWRVVLGSARPTVQNFQFDANDTNENFYGGLGVDAIQLNALSTNTRVDITENGDGSLNAAFGDTASGTARGYFVEAIVFNGGAGDDTVSVDGAFTPAQLADRAVFASGGGGVDLLTAAALLTDIGVEFYGGDGEDILIGGLGNDFLLGQNDDDAITGADGNDSINGNAGDDSIEGNAGSDVLVGSTGEDTISGSDGVDLIYGGTGNDILSGGNESDYLSGGINNDILDAGDGDDEAAGGANNDSVMGGLGNDTLYGAKRVDTVEGGDGDDIVSGAADNDFLDGGDGNDLLFGGVQNDRITGGAGNDTFLYNAGNDIDLITDFVAGAGTEDVIQLNNFGADFDEFAEVIAAAIDDGTDTTINFGSGNLIILYNVVVADLHEDDFIFG